jgi:hypothetical protein
MKDVSMKVSACWSIPAVPDFAAGDWEATARAMRSGVRLEFRQVWKAEAEPDFLAG